MVKFALDRWSIPCCSDNGNLFLPPEFEELLGTSQITVNELNCISGSDDGIPEDTSDINE